MEGWLSEEKLTDGRVHRDSEREPGKLNLRLRKNNYWKVFYRKSPCKLHTFILPYGSSCSNREGKKRNNPWNILGTFYFFFFNVQRDDWGQKHDPVHAFHLSIFSGSRKKRILANRDVMAVKRRGEQNIGFRDHFRCLTSSGCKDQMYTVTIWESQS